jgi:hypothetical protein
MAAGPSLDQLMASIPREAPSEPRLQALEAQESALKGQIEDLTALVESLAEKPKLTMADARKVRVMAEQTMIKLTELLGQLGSEADRLTGSQANPPHRPTSPAGIPGCY